MLGGVPELCIVQKALKQALASQLLSLDRNTHTHKQQQTQKIKNYRIPGKHSSHHGFCTDRPSYTKRKKNCIMKPYRNPKISNRNRKQNSCKSLSVCVCVRERERERNQNKNSSDNNQSSQNAIRKQNDWWPSGFLHRWRTKTKKNCTIKP